MIRICSATCERQFQDCCQNIIGPILSSTDLLLHLYTHCFEVFSHENSSLPNHLMPIPIIRRPFDAMAIIGRMEFIYSIFCR